MAMRINRVAPYIWRFLHVSHPSAKLKRLCFFPGLVLLLVLLLRLCLDTAHVVVHGLVYSGGK
ncbi:hypothetical protein BDV41DRAFT_538629 [Aspergillus transmontanensis]|uniref:Uncharacterized protein n=1 Tax=Aspergillus transmontanensis TaxID=1034304 RepID=A0A5N6W052_9EURO|nr:hypothetical protein BDV41DRAFT_538629 [Aspergillus transmontanensis]